MPGPPPKPAEQRRRQNKDPHPTTTVTADGVTRGPDLPASREWPEQTVAWWGHWRTCAQSQTFTVTDWDFLLDTAVFHAAVWEGTLTAGPELRLLMSKFGATQEDRMRLRLQVDSEVEQVKAREQRTASPGRKARFLKAVDGGA